MALSRLFGKYLWIFIGGKENAAEEREYDEKQFIEERASELDKFKL